MSIYTKTGDKGETGTFDGKRISKSSKLINAIGTIDELNSFLGVVVSFSPNIKIIKFIRVIQSNLFVINSILAGSKIKFSKNETTKLEKQIDIWEKKLPKQKNFIFYGGTPKSAMLFYARALCRHAERSLVKLKIVNCKSEILSYVNRLSDYLFIFARFTNFKGKVKEIIWKT